VTENLRVRSIIGRFLEHSRVFYFANGSERPHQGTFYIGSADWMYRNLSRRVEAVAPVSDPIARARLWEVLDTSLADRRQSWVFGADGGYFQSHPDASAAGAARMGTHSWLMKRAHRHGT
jgi:polyphosphate kinase